MPIFTNPAVQEWLKQKTNPITSNIEFLRPGVTNLAPVGSQASTLGYQIGDKIPELLQGKQVLAPVADVIDGSSNNPLKAGLLGAAAGGAGGALFGTLTDKDPALAAVIGALGLGGTAAVLSHLSNRRRRQQQMLPKMASFYGYGDANPADFLQTRIAQDSSMPFGVKAELSEALGNLSSGQLSEIAKVVKGVVGAGIGVIIAKYLLRFGVTGTLISMLAGGMIGYGRGGQKDQTQRDMFGNARLVQ